MGARLLLSDSQRLYLRINSSLPNHVTDQRMIQAMAHPQDFIGFKGNDVYYQVALLVKANAKAKVHLYFALDLC